MSRVAACKMNRTLFDTLRAESPSIFLDQSGTSSETQGRLAGARGNKLGKEMKRCLVRSLNSVT